MGKAIDRRRNVFRLMVPEGKKVHHGWEAKQRVAGKRTSIRYPSTKFLAQRRFICPRGTEGKEVNEWTLVVSNRTEI